MVWEILHIPFDSTHCEIQLAFNMGYYLTEQDEIIPHLGPGRIPSTVDPDTVETSERGKKLSKRPVKISAWKLAKLDSNEAIRAAAKARASSSVLRPMNPRHQYDSDQGSVSGRSSAISTDHTFNKDARLTTLRSSPIKSSYPPSRTSREDIETCNHSLSSLSSPRHMNSSVGVSPMERRPSNLEHFNPMYQSSAGRSPWSDKTNDVNESAAADNLNRVDPDRKSENNISVNPRSSVYWDQEAGRFMPTSAVRGNSRGLENTSGSSSQVGRPELVYTGQSIFFGGPLLNEGSARSIRTSGLVRPAVDRASSFNIPQGRSERGRGSHQLPVFVPSNIR